ncbi:hypothetical protein TH60_05760 [Pantoea ananatis]|uniref:hypothetical protein n=1 Tax=Pantoea ananas TaxID=553 RepID=UPI00234FC4EA|nr:hypothetical protein [Pantoea ananatis]MDC7868820.1 hypothetical protein [Pantoea ananatis]
MSSMLDPQQYNRDQREKQIDLTIQAMGPTNEKSAFILAILAKNSGDPTAYFKDLSNCVDAAYADGENTDTSVGSTFSEMSNMLMGARRIFEKIKHI